MLRGVDRRACVISQIQNDLRRGLFTGSVAGELSRPRVLKSKPIMRILHLTLKKKWFDMIQQGVKKEEYREIKPYWTKRLKDFEVKKPFDAVFFRNGYSKNAPSFMIECKGVKFGDAKPEWSDGAKGRFYVIELGDFIA